MNLIDYLSQHLFLYLISFFICTVRLAIFLFTIESFTFLVLKGRLKFAVACAFALYPASSLYTSLLHTELTLFFVVYVLTKEVVIGFLIGCLFSVPFWVYNAIGCLIDNQSGRLMGEQLNPLAGSDFTPMGFILRSLCFVFFIAKVGFVKIVILLWQSYTILPVTGPAINLTAKGFDEYRSIIDSAFDFIVLYAFPVVGVLLIIDIGLGILNTFSPQLQSTQLSIPVKCVVGLIFLTLYLSELEAVFLKQTTIFYSFKNHLLLLFS